MSSPTVKIYHANGILKYEGQIDNGLFNGRGKEYRIDGTLMFDGLFKDGEFVPDYENGPLKYEGEWKDGRFDGNGCLFHEDGHTILYEGRFKEGKFHGKGRSYDATGQLRYDGEWKNGRFVFKTEDLPRSLENAQIIPVDDDSYNFSTFQCHNQKVVSNEKGCFMTYVKSRNEKYTAQKWFLLQDRDNIGKFDMLYSSTDPTNPPCLETNEHNDLYVAYPDFVDGNSYLLIFRASEDYKNPVKKTIKNSASGKVCMAYDRSRNRLCYFSNNNSFTVLDLDGNILSAFDLTKRGSSAKVEYPQIYIDIHGTIHALWTTENPSRPYLYWSIHHILSKDGGCTWQNMHGDHIDIPVLSDEYGGSVRITTDEEFDLQTWAHGFTVKDGKVHIIYSPHLNDQNKIYEPYFDPSMRYVRYDLETGRMDHEIKPVFRGDELDVCGFDGFFAHDETTPGSPLYYVSRQGDRIACLLSRDNGFTWHDHALSTASIDDDIYSVNGFRGISKDGYILGSFTQRPYGVYKDVFSSCKTYFIKIKT